MDDERLLIESAAREVALDYLHIKRKHGGEKASAYAQAYIKRFDRMYGQCSNRMRMLALTLIQKPPETW